MAGINEQVARGIKSTLRFLLVALIIYSHFIGKEIGIILWFGMEFDRNTIQLGVVWICVVLLTVNNLIDIINEEKYYGYDFFRDKLDKMKERDKK